MDTMRKTIKLNDMPAEVTFETARGTISQTVGPSLGPGIYEVALTVLWADED